MSYSNRKEYDAALLELDTMPARMGRAAAGKPFSYFPIPTRRPRRKAGPPGVLPQAGITGWGGRFVHNLEIIGGIFRPV